jgi:hypothetical protein
MPPCRPVVAAWWQTWPAVPIPVSNADYRACTCSRPRTARRGRGGAVGSVNGSSRRGGAFPARPGGIGPLARLIRRACGHRRASPAAAGLALRLLGPQDHRSAGGLPDHRAVEIRAGLGPRQSAAPCVGDGERQQRTLNDATNMAPAPAMAATRNSGCFPARSSTRPASSPPTPVMSRMALKIAPSAASGQCVPALIGWIRAL